MRFKVIAAITLSAAAVLQLQSTSAREPDAARHRVALSSAGDGHDTVPVMVNGKGPFPFILDTGADQSAVYQWFADQAALPKIDGKDQDLSGQTGSIKVSMYRLGAVSLAGIEGRELEAYALPNRRDNGKEAGVLGNDVMDRAIVAFDFPCRLVELRPRSAGSKALGAAGVSPVIAGINPGTTLLTLPVTINGAAGIGVLDTGSRWSRLTPSFAQAAGIDPASPAFRDGDPIYGTSGRSIIPRTGPIGQLSFGGKTINGVTAQVVALPVLMEDFGGKPAMLLGADVLGRYRFMYDHAARSIWLLPSRCRDPRKAAPAR